MAPFYGWGSTASRLQPLRGGSLLKEAVYYSLLSAGCSLLMLNFIFKSSSIFLSLDLKITISVIFTLSEILFTFNQLTRHFKSALTSLFSFLIELPRMQNYIA